MTSGMLQQLSDRMSVGIQNEKFIADTLSMFDEIQQKCKND